MELIMTFLPFLAMLGIMWLLLVRPQQKQAKERKAMLDALQPGLYVVTIGGLHGIIDEINHTKQTVVLDCEGVYLTFNLTAIAVVKQTVVSNDTTEPEEDTEELVTEA